MLAAMNIRFLCISFEGLLCLPALLVAAPVAVFAAVAAAASAAAAHANRCVPLLACSICLHLLCYCILNLARQEEKEQQRRR